MWRRRQTTNNNQPWREQHRKSCRHLPLGAWKLHNPIGPLPFFIFFCVPSSFYYYYYHYFSFVIIQKLGNWTNIVISFTPHFGGWCSSSPLPAPCSPPHAMTKGAEQSSAILPLPFFSSVSFLCLPLNLPPTHPPPLAYLPPPWRPNPVRRWIPCTQFDLPPRRAAHVAPHVTPAAPSSPTFARPLLCLRLKIPIDLRRFVPLLRRLLLALGFSRYSSSAAQANCNCTDSYERPIKINQ